MSHWFSVSSRRNHRDGFPRWMLCRTNISRARFSCPDLFYFFFPLVLVLKFRPFDQCLEQYGQLSLNNRDTDETTRRDFSADSFPAFSAMCDYVCETWLDHHREFTSHGESFLAARRSEPRNLGEERLNFNAKTFRSF